MIANGRTMAKALLENMAPPNKAIAAIGATLSGNKPAILKPAAISIKTRIKMFLELIIVLNFALRYFL